MTQRQVREIRGVLLMLVASLRCWRSRDNEGSILGGIHDAIVSAFGVAWFVPVTVAVAASAYLLWPKAPKPRTIDVVAGAVAVLSLVGLFGLAAHAGGTVRSTIAGALSAPFTSGRRVGPADRRPRHRPHRHRPFQPWCAAGHRRRRPAGRQRRAGAAPRPGRRARARQRPAGQAGAHLRCAHALGRQLRHRAGRPGQKNLWDLDEPEEVEARPARREPVGVALAEASAEPLDLPAPSCV